MAVINIYVDKFLKIWNFRGLKNQIHSVRSGTSSEKDRLDWDIIMISPDNLDNLQLKWDCLGGREFCLDKVGLVV